MIRFLASVLVVPGLLALPDPGLAQDSRQIERFLKKEVQRALRKTIKKPARKKTTRKTSAKTRKAPQPVAQRPVNPENRSIQTALNYFGFDAGAADGVLGPRSKSAISGYQAFLGLTATGALSDRGRELLLTSYDRALAEPTAAAHVIAASPHGVKGLLIAYRDGTDAAVAPIAVQPVDSTPAPGGTTGMAPTPMNPQDTLTGYCLKIDEASTAHGGYVSVDAIDDPWRALGEQFCFARDDAIFGGDDLMASVQGLSEEQIVAQCQSLGPLLAPYVVAISGRPQEEVVGEVRDYATTTGMPADQLVVTSRICLSVGYRVDDMEVAIGSALMLAAMGDPLYSELLGHHLMLGIGATQNAPQALGWYDTAMLALEAGAEPVFDPFNPDRVPLIRKASAMIAAPDQTTR